MGMFVEITVKYPLADNPPEEVRSGKFQSKDLEPGLIDQYAITAEGRLIHHDTEYEWVEDATWPLGGYLNPLSTSDVDTNYDGDLNFYTLIGGYFDDRHWYEYEARFEGGQLQEIRQVPKRERERKEADGG